MTAEMPCFVATAALLSYFGKVREKAREDMEILGSSDREQRGQFWVMYNNQLSLKQKEEKSYEPQ